MYFARKTQEHRKQDNIKILVQSSQHPHLNPIIFPPWENNISKKLIKAQTFQDIHTYDEWIVKFLPQL